jgi:ubiquinone/menaquinone biosynthesis C-methylase UbiE
VRNTPDQEEERAAPFPSGPEVPPVSVAQGYARWAASYDHTPNPLLAREERYLQNLLPPLQHRRVIDLACGTGRWLEKLEAQGPALGVGIDFSDAMLEVAFPKSKHLACADCLQLPFSDNVFDLAICSFALSHISDLRRSARELSRVTKSQADVFISDLHPEARALGWRTGFRDIHGSAQIETQPHSQAAIVLAFHSVGFECLKHEALFLGEAEKPIFNLAGKDCLFTTASFVPAVLVCHFRRLAKGPVLAERSHET